MLPAEFASRTEPVVEEIRAPHYDFQGLEGDVLIALGFVVAVHVLKRAVEYGSKLPNIGGHLRKLYDPLVAAFARFVHKDRSSRVFSHLCACLLAGFGQSLFGVVHNEFLAKGIDETFGAARDNEFVGLCLREAHSVANLVAPQAAARGNDDGVIAVCFHLPKGHNLRLFLPDFLQRYELVEHTVVEHQQHSWIGQIALQTEESLGGVVSFHILHPRVAYQTVV